MINNKSIINYKKTERDISSTNTMDESYNEIVGNPNNHLQLTETAGFKFLRFNFRRRFVTNPTQCCGNISVAET